jgi:heptosyltransferase II
MMQKANVVIQTAFLGDLILTIPFLQRLKLLFPEKCLILVCKKGLGQFLLECKIIDEFVEIDKGDRQSYVKALQKLKEY